MDNKTEVPQPLSFALPCPPPGVKHRFHAMIKPAGAACNLACTYCFYLHKHELLDQPAAPAMSDAILEEHIRQYIEAQTGDEVVFSWQGGEPTLLGLDFFRRVVELEQLYKKPFQRIENDLQTNGTLLDEAWARFLKEHNFLVGLSVDGPLSLHDIHRYGRDGSSTHGKVMAAAKLLKKHSVPFAAMCVINGDNAKRPLDVYRFLTRELGAKQLQFSPCVEPKVFETTAPHTWDTASLPMVGSTQSRPGTEGSIVTDWSVDAEDWGAFLCKVWDEWYRRDYGRIHVDLFESAVAQSRGVSALRCVTAEFCGKAVAVEHNGDVYACDHFVYPHFFLGNILSRHLGEMVFSEKQKSFGFAKRKQLPRYCRECEHLKLCWGECPKNRLLRTLDGDHGLNYLCPGLKKFFAHIQRDMPAILRRIQMAGR